MSNPKIVTVGDEVYRAKAVILATGSRWRRLGIPGEDDAARSRRLQLCHL